MALNCGPTEIEIRGLTCVPNDPVGFVHEFYIIGLWLMGFVALIFMIIGGYYIMFSMGDPERLKKGKSYIFYSIAGIVLAILGFVFVEVIAGDILRIPGIKP